MSVQIIVKKSDPKVDPKRPWTRPGYEKAVELGKKRLAKMEFESDGARRDYMGEIGKNPENIPGIPNFFPALEMKSYMPSPWAREYTEEELREIVSERIRQFTIRDIDLYCTFCGRVTTHSINMENSFCKKCGHTKKYHH